MCFGHFQIFSHTVKLLEIYSVNANRRSTPALAGLLKTQEAMVWQHSLTVNPAVFAGAATRICSGEAPSEVDKAMECLAAEANLPATSFFISTATSGRPKPKIERSELMPTDGESNV
jgi:hypothetical protein